MKAKIIRGTTLQGAAINEGDVIDIDQTTFSLFKAQGQAREATPEEIESAKAKIESAKKGK